MKPENVKKDFNFSYAHLKQVGDNILNLIDRDLVEFTDHGFTPAKRTQLVDAIELFANFPTDEQMDGIKVAATIAKDNARKALEAKMRTMFIAAKNVFTENSGEYREFGNSEISRQTDEELVRTGNLMLASANKYASQLLDEGITVTKIDEFQDAKEKLDDNIDLQLSAINNRDTSTENRAKVANVLYHLIVKYCEIGKDIWYETSEAKYNDYVIYNTPSGTNEDAGDTDALSGTVEPSSVKTVTTIDEDVTITMSNTGTEKLYFALSPTEGAGGIDFTVQAGETLTKSTADMSPDGDGEFLLVKNPETVIGSYEVTVEI